MNRKVAEPLLPSVTLGELIDNVGVPSSSVIVPVPVPVAIVALLALLNLRITVSLDSWRASPVTDTSMFLLICPAVKVSMPDVTAV